MPKILYPPRPKGKILPNQLSEFEKSGKWLAQRKFNGTHVVIHILDNDVYMLNRHGTSPKQFVLTERYKKELLFIDLNPTLEYWLDGELLDAKTKSKDYKGKIVLFDLLQAGRYFFNNPTMEERYALLKQICRHPIHLEPGRIALQVTENIWLAETFEDNFAARFKDFLDRDEIEGLVLKRRSSTLDSLGTKEYSSGWLVRCRKPHAGASYEF